MGTVLATDTDTVGSLQGWTIAAGNTNGVFTIDPVTGEITVSDLTLLDFETTPSYVLTLTVTDGVHTSALEHLTIHITDVDELPSGPIPEPFDDSRDTGDEPPPSTTYPADKEEEENGTDAETVSSSLVGDSQEYSQAREASHENGSENGREFAHGVVETEELSRVVFIGNQGREV